MPVARNEWQHVRAGNFTRFARRFTISRTLRRSMHSPVKFPFFRSAERKRGVFNSSAIPAACRYASGLPNWQNAIDNGRQNRTPIDWLSLFDKLPDNAASQATVTSPRPPQVGGRELRKRTERLAYELWENRGDRLLMTSATGTTPNGAFQSVRDSFPPSGLAPALKQRGTVASAPPGGEPDVTHSHLFCQKRSKKITVMCQTICNRTVGEP